VQKQFLDGIGLPQARWAPAGDPAELEAALERIGRPAILKVRRAGYDGKGQVRIDASGGSASGGGDPVGAGTRPGPAGVGPVGADFPAAAAGAAAGPAAAAGAAAEPAAAAAAAASAALARIHGQPAVVEEVVPFQREISVVLARGLDGSHRIYPIAENVHRRHILHTTRAPAPMGEAQRRRAEEIAISVADALGHVGVMAVEMFELADGRLLVNEIAPRTHNSGHYTYGACATSQFEQHVRAICGLALGDPRPLSGAVMLNLIGDLWSQGPPRWQHVLAHPGARLHLYGKDAPAPGRKMGHVVLLDDDTDRALADADALIAALAAPT